MSKATKNGHCQFCGRIHAVSEVDGRLAKHGYTVSYGFFNGQCNGSKELPLEVSRVELDRSVDWLNDTAHRIEHMLSVFSDDQPDLKLQAHNYLPYMVQHDMERGKTRDERKLLEAVSYTKDTFIVAGGDEFGWKNACARYKSAQRANVNGLRNHAEMLLKLAADIHGKPFVDRAKPERELKVFPRAERRAGRQFAEAQRAGGLKVTTRVDKWTGELKVWFN